MRVWGSFLTLRFMLLYTVVSSVVVSAETTIIPSNSHIDASRVGVECSIYKRLIEQAEVEIVEHQRALQKYLAELKQQRDQLDTCAQYQGIGNYAENREVLLAEYCSHRYDAWLVPGYRVRMLHEDIEENRDTIRGVISRYQTSCGRRLLGCC